jgi:hypothetical protein
VYRCTGSCGKDGGSDRRKSEYGQQGIEKGNDAKEMTEHTMQETYADKERRGRDK